MSDKIIAVCYDRISTNRQAEEGVMLDARSEKLPLYCQMMGYDYSEDRFFTDPGYSGWADIYRPGFDRAMKLACQPGHVLVVDSLNRFCRSNIEADKALKRLHAAGANIAIVSLGVDTLTAAGRLVYRIIASAAEFESEQISERTKAAAAYIRKKKGYCTWGVQPWGYMLDENNNRVECPEEQDVIAAVKQIGRQFDIAIVDPKTGKKRRVVRHWRKRVLAEVNRQGIPTPTTLRNRKRTPPGPDVEWSTDSIYEVLRMSMAKQRRDPKARVSA